MNGKPTFIELFAGIGGFRVGLEKAGWQCVWANEKDQYCCQIYRNHFGDKELVEGDITTISTDDIPNADMLCGGFPCQPFSTAGERKGFQDIRGTLFFEITRIAAAKRPKILFLENVEGLLSHEKGKTFETIIRTLDEMGYLVEWQLLNSKYHRVAQSRPRVFIIGHLRQGSTPKILPIQESHCLPLQKNAREQEAKKRLRGGLCPTLRATYHKGYQTRGPLIASTIDGRYGALRNGGETYVCENP